MYCVPVDGWERFQIDYKLLYIGIFIFQIINILVYLYLKILLKFFEIKMCVY